MFYLFLLKEIYRKLYFGFFDELTCGAAEVVYNRVSPRIGKIRGSARMELPLTDPLPTSYDSVPLGDVPQTNMSPKPDYVLIQIEPDPLVVQIEKNAFLDKLESE